MPLLCLQGIAVGPVKRGLFGKTLQLQVTVSVMKVDGCGGVDEGAGTANGVNTCDDDYTDGDGAECCELLSDDEEEVRNIVLWALPMACTCTLE